MRRCPEETDPMQFLRYCQHDTWAAASRLCCYWKFRLELFGPDRAFRSMDDLSGNGAMDPEVIQFLNGGSALPLPNLSNGKGAVLLDRRLNKGEIVDSPKVNIPLIYLLTQFAKFEWAQKEGGGLQLFHVFLPQNATNFNFGGMQHFVNFLTHAAPVRMTAHLLVDDVGGLSSVWQHLATCYIQIAVSLGFNQGNKYIIHKARSLDERLQQLQALGARKDGIPPSLGGTWEYPPNILHWCEHFFGKDRLPTNGECRLSMNGSEDDTRNAVHQVSWLCQTSSGTGKCIEALSTNRTIHSFVVSFSSGRPLHSTRWQGVLSRSDVDVSTIGEHRIQPTSVSAIQLI